MQLFALVDCQWAVRSLALMPRAGGRDVTVKHLIAYAIILLALAGIVLTVIRSRRRPGVRHERIDITRGDP